MAQLLNEATQYTDQSTGELIVNGSIYIGAQNLDPKLNLITIYSDRDLLVPIANPQLTGADGRAINKIWIPEEYSLAVYNSNDVQKYISLDSGTEDGYTNAEIDAEIAANKTTKYYDTIALAVADIANINIGDVIYPKDRGGTWDAVDATAVTENEFNIITGNATVSFELRIGDNVNAKELGAVGDGVTDNVDVLQAGLDLSVLLKKSLYIPAGRYAIDTKLEPTYVDYLDSENDAIRQTTMPIIGDGMFETVLLYSGADYCIDYTYMFAKGAVTGIGTYAGSVANTQLHYLNGVNVQGIQIKAFSGGGIATGAIGTSHIADFFMNGCGAGFWALYLDGTADSFDTDLGSVGYNITLERLFLWNNNTNYNGGGVYANSFFGLHWKDSFMSMNYKDGDMNFFAGAKMLKLSNLMIEAIDSTLTNQVGIALGGSGVGDTNQVTIIDTIHTEQHIPTLIKLGSTQQKNISISGVNSGWLAGNPDVVLLDCSTSANHENISIDNFYYYNADTGAGTVPLINDPYHVATITNSFNGSTGNQANREITSNPYIDKWGSKTTGVIRNNSASNLPTESMHKWSGTAETYYSSRRQMDASGNLAFGIDSASAEIGSESITDVVGINRAWQAFQFLNNASTGAGSAALGANCPAITATAPYTWIRVLAPDGTVCFQPIWQ